MPVVHADAVVREHFVDLLHEAVPCRFDLLLGGTYSVGSVYCVDVVAVYCVRVYSFHFPARPEIDTLGLNSELQTSLGFLLQQVYFLDPIELPNTNKLADVFHNTTKEEST
jgi:hypothetical protein